LENELEMTFLTLKRFILGSFGCFSVRLLLSFFRIVLKIFQGVTPMINPRIFFSALFLFLLCLGWVSYAMSEEKIEPSLCLNRSADEGCCKDCCDSLEVDAASRRHCRDACIVHDFSLNTNIMAMPVVSHKGPIGDYAAALSAGDGPACKDYCDGTANLTNGDRHYCRDACNVVYGQQPAPQKVQVTGAKELPPEIVAACQGKNAFDSCQVGEIFHATCQTHQEQLTCLLSQEQATPEQKQQWSELDHNQDGFLDVNEAKEIDHDKDLTPVSARE
jgi:hypothetical protein